VKADTRFGKGLTRAQFDAHAHQQFIRLQVKQVCCSVGVPVITLPSYYCFGLEVDRLKEMDLSGEALALEVEVVLAKWVGRGLSQQALEAIRSSVFNIDEPKP